MIYDDGSISSTEEKLFLPDLHLKSDCLRFERKEGLQKKEGKKRGLFLARKRKNRPQKVSFFALSPEETVCGREGETKSVKEWEREREVRVGDSLKGTRTFGMRL